MKEAGLTDMRTGKCDLKKLPDTSFVAPSLVRIPCSLPQLFLTFAKFPATTGQLLSPSVMILPRYLNLGTVCI